jgi:3-hydroxyacyl-CoA dehydrogenase
LAQVVLYDSNPAGLEKGMGMVRASLDILAKKAVKAGTDEATAKAHTAAVLSRLSAASSKAALADVDIVVEAIIENLDIKKTFYKELGAVVKPSAIFATNTSSFEVGFMSDASGRPGKMVGMHVSERPHKGRDPPPPPPPSAHACTHPFIPSMHAPPPETAPARPSPPSPHAHQACPTG